MDLKLGDRWKHMLSEQCHFYDSRFERLLWAIVYMTIDEVRRFSGMHDKLCQQTLVLCYRNYQLLVSIGNLHVERIRRPR